MFSGIMDRVQDARSLPRKLKRCRQLLFRPQHIFYGSDITITGQVKNIDHQ
jgi:hypothetical protein